MESEWKGSGLVNMMQIKEQLELWSVRFGMNLDPGQINQLVEDYSTALKGQKWKVQRFTAAAIRVTLDCKSFPQVADLIVADKEVQREAGVRYTANSKGKKSPTVLQMLYDDNTSGGVPPIKELRKMSVEQVRELARKTGLLPEHLK